MRSGSLQNTKYIFENLANLINDTGRQPKGESSELGLLKESVAEQLSEKSGYWYSCSGCHESGECGENSGNYPFSDIFKCNPCSGCHECGGIGVIWDDTDYSDIGKTNSIEVRS